MRPRIAVVEHERKVPQSTRRALRDALTDAGMPPVSWVNVPKASETTGAVTAAVRRGAQIIIVCGGDGTVRAAAEAVVDTDVALAVVPTGTANLFARGLDLPAEPHDVVELITTGKRRRLDTGRCNSLTFGVMAGAGFDAAMIDEAGSLAKHRLGVLSYFRAGLIHARRRPPFQASVTVDGAPYFDGPATCVLVANFGSLPGGLTAFPAASPNDGLLDVGVITATGLREWAALIISIARGRQLETSHAHLTQATRIDVQLVGTHRFELDGGTKGTTDRLRFHVRPASLLVCAPP